jgi:1-acyl-sn-glycerol-3-phosphate acyltransferase
MEALRRDRSLAPEDRWTARTLRVANAILARVYHRTIVRSPHHLPRRGPGILVCNHISGLDPVLVQSVCPRLVVWMMAREYYEIRGLKWLFRTVEAIPVDRSGRDMTATRSALRALADGRILGIFPEGRIETSRDLLPFQTGVAMMAIKTGVPVYPAYMEGTQRGMDMIPAFLTPQEVTLSFGPAVEFDRGGTSHVELEAATELIQGAVWRLRPPRKWHPG